jgi:CrcB protein
VIGVLGGFTTYSAFALDAVRLLELGLVGPALAYVAGTTLLGIAAAAAGLGLTRTLGLG